MASVSIRDLDDEVRDRLRIRAARNGRSMEAEMRAILTAAVADDETRPRDFVRALVDAFHDVGGVTLEIPERMPHPGPVEFRQ